MIVVQLFQVATRCDVVLCCRVAPLQKAGIVALIKNRTDDMTLAIGDGRVFFFLNIVHRPHTLTLLLPAPAGFDPPPPPWRLMPLPFALRSGGGDGKFHACPVSLSISDNTASLFRLVRH
jgi:hypothetical protein